MCDNNNNYLRLLAEMVHNPTVLVNYFTDEDLPQISKLLSSLEDDELLEWAKKAIPMLEGEQLQVDGAMAKIKTIIDQRVHDEAAQAGWYKCALVPASQRYQSAAQIIKRHRITCTTAWGPLWSTVIDEGKLGSSTSRMNIH
jgi:hypothetical protein